MVECGRVSRFFCYSKASRLALGLQTSCPVDTEGLIHLGYNNWCVKLTFCLHQLQRLRMIGTTPFFLHISLSHTQTPFWLSFYFLNLAVIPPMFFVFTSCPLLHILSSFFTSFHCLLLMALPIAQHHFFCWLSIPIAHLKHW